MPPIRILSLFPTALAVCFSVDKVATATPMGNPKAKLAAFSLPHDPVKDAEKVSRETTHVTLVLVGDTGYAPHGVRPNAKGVSKHGSWQTWDQTTRRIRSQINGDINFANIETVISNNGRLRRWPKAFNFITHANGARHLVDVGFNLFSMANNHSFDFGASGIRDSLKHADNLKNHGLLAHAGIGLNRAQAAHVPVFSAKDTQFAFGAIGIGATYGGLPRASEKRPGQLGINHKTDVRLLMNNLKQARADYRILSVHRGYERIIRVDGSELSQVRNKMLEQGDVDLLIGHHAHVTRGVEINNGKLIFYGLGNFLHHGTANMVKHGRCKDYSIIARVHLVREGENKPQLAAVEIVPITETHRQTRPLKPRTAAKKIAILNGLARQFDNPARGAKGVRFSTRWDGTGLYCTPAAANHNATSSLCLDYDPQQAARARVYRAALSSCGRSYSPVLMARRTKPAVQRLARPGKPSVRPNIIVASLPKVSLEPAVKPAPKGKGQPTSFPPAKGKPVYDAGLLRPDLRAMSKADVKAYWTLVWYTRKGLTPPPELALLAEVQKKTVPVSTTELAAAWNVLPSAKPPVIEVDVPTQKARSETKVALLAAWQNLEKGTVKRPATPPQKKPDAKVVLAAAWDALTAKKKPELKAAKNIKLALATAWNALEVTKIRPVVAEEGPKAAKSGQSKGDLLSAWAALPQQTEKPQPTARSQSKPVAKSALAEAWAALASQKTDETSSAIAASKDGADKPVVVAKVNDEAAGPAKAKEDAVKSGKVDIYDAGLKRPDFKNMTKTEIKAYWTRVWYARRNLRRKRNSASSS